MISPGVTVSRLFVTLCVREFADQMRPASGGNGVSETPESGGRVLAGGWCHRLLTDGFSALAPILAGDFKRRVLSVGAVVVGHDGPSASGTFGSGGARTGGGQPAPRAGPGNGLR